MTDPREMLARLNPTNVRFDVGRGGGNPELTNIDIAGALGMVPAGLGREVLEACWWPEGAATRRHGLRDAVVALVGVELARQNKRLIEAHLDAQLAEAAIMWGGRACTAEQRTEVQRAQMRLAEVRKACWPKNTMERLPLIARAIVNEIVCAYPVVDDEGQVLTPDRRRAIAIDVDPSDYPKRWKVVYQWVMDQMVEAEQEAARALAQALRREAA